MSFGERALFQFVKSSRPGARDEVVSQTWLEDGSDRTATCRPPPEELLVVVAEAGAVLRFTTVTTSS